jgi:hypothetical protein
MWPVTLENARWAVELQSILLLDTRLLELQRFAQLLIPSNDNVRSAKGRVSLPIEIWIMILEYLVADAPSVERKDRLCYVQADRLIRATLVWPENNENNGLKATFLRCHRVRILDSPICGDLYDAAEVQNYETFLHEPHKSFKYSEMGWDQYNKPPEDLPSLQIERPETNFSVLVACSGGYTGLLSAFFNQSLFYRIEVPDIISIFEDGRCGFCGGARFVCPGCGGRGDRFDTFMGCGVDLACPLCMGLDFAWDAKDFLNANYGEDPEEEELEQFNQESNERLEELGYLNDRTRDVQLR